MWRKILIIEMGFSFYKNKKTDIIYWVENSGVVGEHLFTFDKEKIYNLFADYPHNLPPEEKEIFDKENPYWCDFFKDRWYSNLEWDLQSKMIILWKMQVFLL